ELKDNVKRAWWKAMVQLREDVVVLDASILMHPRVWEASGHVESFTDPLIECLHCHHRFRADHLPDPPVCPDCGNRQFTDARNFNLMFKTYAGPVEDAGALVWLRPETAQGIFVDFTQVLATSRKKIPFGIAQRGKAFRNEITPGNFIFRTREFEQMELEYFVKPGEAEAAHQYWIDARFDWYLRLGMRTETRGLRAFLADAYREEEGTTASGKVERRTVLALHKDLAPYKAAVLPLSRYENLVPLAKRVASLLRPHWMIDYDDAGSIGRRYRRQD